MVGIRFAALLLGLLVSFVAPTESIAIAHQASNTEKLTNVDRIDAGDQEPHAETNTAAAATSTSLRGRKFGVEDEAKKEVMKAKVTTNPGANHFTEKCGSSRKGKLNAKCQLSARRLPSRANLVGYMLSDYRMARTHPPKNN